jgi:hypothetical protein
MTQPVVEQRTVHTVGTVSLSRVLMFIAAVCMLLGAITECGVSIGGAPALAWVFGGLSAWALASVV